MDFFFFGEDICLELDQGIGRINQLIYVQRADKKNQLINTTKQVITALETNKIN